MTFSMSKIFFSNTKICRNYGLTKNSKISTHSLQECSANKNVEIRVDTRIPTGINVKYNKPDIYILDKRRKKILIVEVGITSFNNLRTVEVEKKHKYDLLANYCGALHKYKTRIIPYVMTWDGMVTQYHREYMKELKLNSNVAAYVQTRVLKMTLESLTMDSRRGVELDIGANEVDGVDVAGGELKLSTSSRQVDKINIT